MDVKDYALLDGELLEILKEVCTSEKIIRMRKMQIELGYKSLLEFFLKGEELYTGMVEETRKGKLVHLLVKEPGTLEKVLSDLTFNDKVINPKVKGLEYINNGKNKEYPEK